MYPSFRGAAGVMLAPNPGGFALNDVALLETIQAVLAARCGG